jgi:hypothetical protein
MANYHSIDEVLSGVGRGDWRVVGREPQYTETTTKDPDTGNPVKTRTQTSTVWSIQSADGTQTDTMEVGDVEDPSVKGGTAITVLKAPTKNLTPGTTKATPAAGLERLDKDGKAIPADDKTTTAVYVRDPAAPASTPPFKLEGDTTTLGDPTTWTPIHRDPNDPKSQVVGLYDPKSQKVAASLSPEPNAKASGTFTNVQVNGKTVGMVDDGDKSFHPLSAQADGKTIVTTSQGVYSYDKDADKLTLLQTIDPNTPLQVVTYPDGSIYTLDPKEKDPTKQLTKLQGTQPPATITQASPGGNVTLVYDPETKSYKLPPGTTAPATIDNSTTLKTIIYRDDKGNVISEHANPNYVAPQTTQGTQSTTAPQIQQWNAKTGQWEWVENKGRVVASEALHNMAQQLTGQVVKGDISQDEAVALINAANAKMTNDIAAQKTAADAASTVLSNTATNASTGAGMLNQRVQSATGALNSIISSAAGSKMTNLPAGIGQGLVQGLTDWTTQLGGGDATYDTAARLVQAADPKISGDPTLAQQAAQTLAGMFSQWQQQNNQPHPLVAATQAAQGSQANNGLVAPVTIAGNAQGQQTNVGVDQALQQQQAAAAQQAQAQAAAMRARGLLDNPQGRAIAAGQTPVAAQGAPTTPGLYNPAWLQGMISAVGAPSVGPNAANGFVAPPLPMIPVPA